MDYCEYVSMTLVCLCNLIGKILQSVICILHFGKTVIMFTLVTQLQYFRYDQALLRSHFLKCIEERRMTPFPAKQIKVPKPIQKMKVQLHCICRLPEDGEEEMAYCPSCHMWYHKSCERIPDIVFQDSSTNWACSKCSL